MTVSEATLRTLAGLSQGRNPTAAWAAIVGDPNADPAYGDGVSGVDLQETVLSTVTLLNGFRRGSWVTDYVGMSTTPGGAGTLYELDYDGTSAAYTTVGVSETIEEVMTGLFDALVVADPADYQDLALLHFPDQFGSAEEWVIRSVRLTGAGAAPTIVADLGDLDVYVGGANSVTCTIHLMQTLANGDSVWAIPAGGVIELAAGESYTERLSTAGYDRICVQITGATPVEAYAGPCLEETS